MTLEDTLIFAANAHRGQVDKAGQPYILHPLRVLNNLGLNAPLEHQMAALLHDVMEDCGVTHEMLKNRGFPETVIVAVEHLTKNAEGEADYNKAIDRVMLNPIAVKVKLADLSDNMDMKRLGTPTEYELKRLEKYQRAKERLENHTFYSQSERYCPLASAGLTSSSNREFSFAPDWKRT